MGLRTLQNAVVRGVAGARTKADAPVQADAERLKRYQQYLDFYQQYLDFYNGKQWERTRPGRANLVVNYCRAVVDKVVSYLLGDGGNFAVAPDGDGDGADAVTRGRGDAETRRTDGAASRAAEAEKLIYRVYEDSNLEAVDGQAATNGRVLGDSVFKVFWDRGRGLPRVVSVDPMRFFCSWAEDDLATLLKAHQVYWLSVEEARRRFGDGVSGRRGDAGTAGRGGAE